MLVGAGLTIGLSSQPGVADFGWFAYAPPPGDSDWQMGWSDAAIDGSSLIVARWQLAGGAVAAVGLLVLVAGVGFRLGQRRATV